MTVDLVNNVKKWTPGSVRLLIREQLAPHIELAGLDPNSVEDSDNLYANGILDSYLTVEILVAIEEETGIQADLTRADNHSDEGLALSVNRLVLAFCSS